MMPQESLNAMGEVRLNKALIIIENRKTFEELLIEAIDEHLLCLCESCRKAIYSHLNQQYGIKREEIPYKINEFAKALEEIFGSGAALVEIGIMKTLYKKSGVINYLIGREEFSFVDYSGNLRLQL